MCLFIKFKDLIDNMCGRILYHLKNPETIVPVKEIRIRIECQSPHFAKEVQRPKMEVLAISLAEANPERPSILNQTFGFKEDLHTVGLDLVVKRGVRTKIIMGDSTHIDPLFFRCPKLTADREARIGVRSNPQNPNKKQRTFGFDAIIDTTIEVTLESELPLNILPSQEMQKQAPKNMATK